MDNNNNNKYCVFCGKEPVDKNKEHILPLWLIEMTGDPKRVVPIAVDFKTQDFIKFDWSSFVFPSCQKCNDRFSKLEVAVKPIVEKLLERKSVNSYQIVLLLDWLDKVRIGLWLGHGYLQNNFWGIKHKFYIGNRIGMKDRMLAVYPIDNQGKGLNTFGVETIYFNIKPSCFSIRINNIHILNLSWDFMCSARCGFPFPINYYFNIEGNMQLKYNELEIYNKVKHPIIKEKFIKPSIHIYQPIIINEISDEFKDHSFLKNKMFMDSRKYGALFRQYDDHVSIISKANEEIDFDEISFGQEDYTKNIVKQTFEFQLMSLSSDNFQSKSKDVIQKHKALFKDIQKDILKYINHFNSI
ncbi:MAG: hypothetical protein ACYDA4_16480 [Ignavibacteriaceae bacterium]